MRKPHLPYKILFEHTDKCLRHLRITFHKHFCVHLPSTPAIGDNAVRLLPPPHPPPPPSRNKFISKLSQNLDRRQRIVYEAPKRTTATYIKDATEESDSDATHHLSAYNDLLFNNEKYTLR